jgi:hypothetical protein
MKQIIASFICVFLYSNVFSQDIISIEPTYVGNSRQAVIVLEFNSAITKIPDKNKFSLVNNIEERVYCSEIQTKVGIKFISFIFQINSSNFLIFEKLTSDSSGYYILNEEAIEFLDGKLEAGRLMDLTSGKIQTISKDDWNRYILNEYSSHFLFPNHFQIGTQLGLQDTTETGYFLEMIQSGNWITGGQPSVFWGIKGRWSTISNDKLDYIQVYPVTVLFSQTSWRLALSAGVETGYQGFSRLGGGTLKSEIQFRLPFNPVDMTLGNPRWRINPVVNLAVQGNIGWANLKLPDSLKNSFDVSAEIKYDIPVAKTFYLQTKARGNYSSVTEELQYQYELSLGYIANGEVRIMLLYKQGYQEVSYVFDKQLLLGFAFDILNESVVK